MIDELDLRVKRPIESVPLDVVETVDSLAEAISKSAARSGLKDKPIAIEVGVDPGLWSRIKSGDAGVKGDFLDRLMDACGNELPLLYLIHSRGYDIHSLRRRESETERQLREANEANEQLRGELETIKKFVKETRGS